MVHLSRNRGFTLIELLITMAVMAVLAMIAMPGFTSLITSNRAQTQTAAFVGALNYARAEAVKRGQVVTLTASDGTNWHTGWTISVGGNDLRVQQAFSTGGATLTSGNSSIAFDAQGRRTGAAAGNTVAFSYCFGEGSDDLERQVRVNHIGSIRVDREVCDEADAE